VKIAAAVLAILFALCAAAALGYGIWWTAQSNVVYQCVTPTFVDYGGGFGHSPTVYLPTSEGGNIYPSTDNVGQFKAGVKWCGRISNGNNYRGLP